MRVFKNPLWVGCFGALGCLCLWILWFRAQSPGLRVEGYDTGFSGFRNLFPTVAQQRPSNELHAVMNLTSGPVGSSEVTVHLAV